MYRNMSLLILAGMIFLLSVSCTTSVTAAGTPETSLPVVNKPLSLEAPPPVPIMKITAKVVVGPQGDIMLAEDWNSKSKKSYKVVGAMTTILEGFRDQIIAAEVIFLEKSTWSGSLVLVEFEVLNEKVEPIKP